MAPKFPVFVLIGDSFLCEEKRKEILASLEKQFKTNLPVALLRAGDRPLESLLSEARTLPFLVPAQIFCVRDADLFTKNDLKLWSAYFESPHTQTFFVFEAPSLAKGHPLLEWGTRAKQLFSLASQGERVVSDFIRRKLQQAQKKITGGALDQLISRLGDSFIFLDSLVDQLILYSGEKEEIEPSDVEALEERLIQWEAGDLVQALAERDVPKALEALHDLLELSAQDFPSVVGLLHWQLRRFWKAKKELAEGASERDVASRLGIWSTRAPGFFKQLSRFSLEELEQILAGLFDLDWQLKSGRAQGRYEIESWLIRGIAPQGTHL